MASCYLGWDFGWLGSSRFLPATLFDTSLLDQPGTAAVRKRRARRHNYSVCAHTSFGVPCKLLVEGMPSTHAWRFCGAKKDGTAKHSSTEMVKMLLGIFFCA